jgi:hypothetical protein
MRTLDPESGVNLFILERTDMGITPSQIMKVLDHIKDFNQANKNIKRCDLIAQVDFRDDKPKVEVYSSIVKPPNAFIAGRVFVDAKYLYPDELLCIMSSEGNKMERQQYMEENAAEFKGFSIAHCNISGFKFSPFYDKNDTSLITGTSVVFMSESDFGGSMPKWFLQKFTPGGLFDFYEDLIDKTRKTII